MYIWTSVVFYSFIAIFKVANSFFQAKMEDTEPASYIKSYTKGNLAESVYWEVLEVIGSLISIYMILKVKNVRYDFVIYGFNIFQSISMNILFVYDPFNPLIQTKFLYTIAFAHIMRLNSFFFVSIACFISAIWFMNVSISTTK
jgi:hypothetical protein